MKGNCLEDSLGFIVNTAGKSMSNRLTQNFKQAGYDVTYEQWTLLVELWEKDGRSQNDIASSTCRDQPCTSRLIDTLVKRGLIQRIPDPMDRRSKLIFLTEKGIELQKGLIQLATLTVEEAIREIDPKDLEVCKQVLKKISSNLQ